MFWFIFLCLQSPFAFEDTVTSNRAKIDRYTGSMLKTWIKWLYFSFFLNKYYMHKSLLEEVHLLYFLLLDPFRIQCVCVLPVFDDVAKWKDISLREQSIRWAWDRVWVAKILRTQETARTQSLSVGHSSSRQLPHWGQKHVSTC